MVFTTPVPFERNLLTALIRSRLPDKYQPLRFGLTLPLNHPRNESELRDVESVHDDVADDGDAERGGEAGVLTALP